MALCGQAGKGRVSLSALQAAAHWPRSRALSGNLSMPLAVSGPRGVVATLQNNGSRAMLFDLEEDESHEDDEDEEQEEED